MREQNIDWSFCDDEKKREEFAIVLRIAIFQFVPSSKHRTIEMCQYLFRNLLFRLQHAVWHRCGSFDRRFSFFLHKHNASHWKFHWNRISDGRFMEKYLTNDDIIRIDLVNAFQFQLLFILWNCICICICICILCWLTLIFNHFDYIKFQHGQRLLTKRTILIELNKLVFFASQTLFSPVLRLHPQPCSEFMRCKKKHSCSKDFLSVLLIWKQKNNQSTQMCLVCATPSSIFQSPKMRIIRNLCSHWKLAVFLVFLFFRRLSNKFSIRPFQVVST